MVARTRENLNLLQPGVYVREFVCELHCSVTALGVRLNYGGSADEDRSTLSHPTQAAAGHEGGKHMGGGNCASSMRLRSVSVLAVLWIRRRLGAVGP